MSETVSYYEDSKEIEKKIWELLSTAVKDRSSEFRTPVFICGNDKDLDGRVVVLRKTDQQNNVFQYHSDIRISSFNSPIFLEHPESMYLAVLEALKSDWSSWRF